MSTTISAIHLALAPALNISFVSVSEWLFGMLLGAVLLYLFKPLLRGLVLALLLIVKRNLNKEQYLARRKMVDAIMLKRMAASDLASGATSKPA